MAYDEYVSGERELENVLTSDEVLPSNEWMETVRAAAEVGRDSFPDQIDYYDPETGELR